MALDRTKHQPTALRLEPEDDGAEDYWSAPGGDPALAAGEGPLAVSDVESSPLHDAFGYDSDEDLPGAPAVEARAPEGAGGAGPVGSGRRVRARRRGRGPESEGPPATLVRPRPTPRPPARTGARRRGGPARPESSTSRTGHAGTRGLTAQRGALIGGTFAALAVALLAASSFRVAERRGPETPPVARRDAASTAAQPQTPRRRARRTRKVSEQRSPRRRREHRTVRLRASAISGPAVSPAPARSTPVSGAPSASAPPVSAPSSSCCASPPASAGDDGEGKTGGSTEFGFEK